MLRWLTRLIAGFLVASICTAIITIVVGRTLLNSTYLEQKADQTNTYSQLSDAINTELVKNSDSINNPQIVAAIKQIVTPAVVREKVNMALDQFSAYYKGTGLPPTIDLTAQVNQARALGIPIPANSNLDKPIVLSSNNTQTKVVNQKIEGLKTISLISIGVSFVLLLFLSWERHRYAVLPDIAIVCGIIMGIIAAALTILPSIASKYIKFDFNSNDFAAIGHSLALSILHDMGKTFTTIAIVFLVVGVISRIAVGVLQLGTRA